MNVQHHSGQVGGRFLGPVRFESEPASGVPLVIALDPPASQATVLLSTARPARWDAKLGFWANIFGPRAFAPPAHAQEPALPKPEAGRVDLPEGPEAGTVADALIAGPVIAPPPPPPVLPPEEIVAPPVSFIVRLRDGLSRSSGRLAGGISSLFTERKLDGQAVEDLEDLLITGDLGAETAARLVSDLAKNRFGKEVSADEIREALATGIAEVLEPVAKPLEINPALKPHVVLVVGVNGSGKTTTIGKIAKQLTGEGKSVMLAAGDTFRAAAVEQLKVWGERTGAPVIAREAGADSAGLAYEALEKARAEGVDVLLIDTAGRLHNKTELMEELKKVVRVLRKIDPDVPHTVLQVLDATVGQNAHQQVKVFSDMVDVTGLAMTKLDGTAKGGVVVSLADKFKIPVHYVGVGEGADDLRPFAATDFARSLMGLERLN